jgi:organic radical activating enzyme
MQSIAVLCTTKCDTGCKHCSFNSKPQGEDLPIECIKTLKKSIKNYEGEVKLTFTGGGEPLMWQHLPEAVSILKDLPNVYFSMVTSGCLNKNDNRFFILKEALKQAEGKIMVEHSFNLFSPSFPERLGFTLPLILVMGAYKHTLVKLTSGLLQEEDFMDFDLDEVIDSFEKIFRQKLGDFSKLIIFSAEDGGYSATALGNYLKRETLSNSLMSWLTLKAFWVMSEYTPYNLSFRGKGVIAYGSFVQMHGRAKKLLPSTVSSSGYYYSYGFGCCAYGKTLELSTRGDFVFCPYKGFPPFFLGKTGDNLKKVSQARDRLSKKLNLPRQFISESGFDPCKNCISKAWQIYYKQKNV